MLCIYFSFLRYPSKCVALSSGDRKGAERFRNTLQSSEYWIVVYRGPSLISCCRMIRLLAHPPLPTTRPSACCLSFSVFLYVAGRAYWRERGGEKEFQNNVSVAISADCKPHSCSDSTFIWVAGSGFGSVFWMRIRLRIQVLNTWSFKRKPLENILFPFFFLFSDKKNTSLVTAADC